MENGQQKHYELRSRSRSRSETPQIFPMMTVNENEASEHHYELRSISRDRSMTPSEVSSSRRSSSRSLSSTVVKSRNKNMEAIVEQNDTLLVQNNSDSLSKVSNKFDSITKNNSKKERRSERQRHKKQVVDNGQIVIKDDSIDTKSETKERKRESVTPKRIITSDYSSEEGDREDIPSRPNSAYEFYKQYGEYWNKFPKTDYTYSLASTCRYEVAPGVMAIPNMSRRSLHSDTNSFGNQTANGQSSSSTSSSSTSSTSTSTSSNSNSISTGTSSQSPKGSSNVDEIRRDLISDMVPQLLPQVKGSTSTAGQSIRYKRTNVEQYTSRREFIYDSAKDNQINERYESWANPLLNSHKTNRFKSTINADSDTEFDDAIASNYRYQLKDTRRFSRFTSLFSTWFFTLLHFITFGLFKKREFSTTTSHYYCRYKETKWSRLKQQIHLALKYVYFFFVKAVLLDSWLLSRATNIRQRAQRRRTKILWLIFLPFLLTIGCWFLPYILSAIPLSIRHVLSPARDDTPTVQSYYQEDLKSNQELRDIVNGLISRVQHLELTKTEQSDNLLNITQVLEELKRSDSDIWKHYDDELLNLKQVVEVQNRNKENCKTEELHQIRLGFHRLKQLYVQSKSCCDRTSHTISDENVRKHVEQVITGYFGNSFTKEDIASMIRTLNKQILDKQDSSQILNEAKASINNVGHLNVGIDDIRKIVLDILKIYDADKTGRVDYALESAGGQVISIGCTQPYSINTRVFHIAGLIPYSSDINSPRTVIQGNELQPGMCWAFQDFPGHLLIKLRSLIYVTGFTIEHASRLNLPNGEMKSAPKKFNVWGLKSENDLEPVLFGEYEFLDSQDNLQYFEVQNTSIKVPYEYVELRIHSNHGQLEYTCLYRFRIHGNLA